MDSARRTSAAVMIGMSLIVLFVDGVADVRRGDFELFGAGLDLHRLRDRAHRQNDVFADRIRALKHESRN